MNFSKYFGAVAALTLLSGIFLMVPAARAAFGISPPFLNAGHLVPGVNYTQTVYLVQDHPDQDLSVKAALTIPDRIASWITVDKGFNFVIPKDVRQFPVQISVHVPEGEGIGKYSGNLSFTGQPSQTGQVTIALGVNVAINLTVGTGIYEQYSVPLVRFPDIEEGWSPRVYVKFKNDGNIPESFDSATFEIFDQYDAIRLAYIQKQSGFIETPPFTTNEYTLEFPTDFYLGIGEYWGVVTFYKEQKVVATQKTIFNVLKEGAILGPWGSFFYKLGKSDWLRYGVVALAAVLLAAAVWRRRARRSARSRSS